jgi:hypothetical protein
MAVYVVNDQLPPEQELPDEDVHLEQSWLPLVGTPGQPALRAMKVVLVPDVHFPPDGSPNVSQ